MVSSARPLAPIALTFALLTGACQSRNAGNTVAQDTSSANLQLANRDSTAQPQLRDVPAGHRTPQRQRASSGSNSDQAASSAAGGAPTGAATSGGATATTPATTSSGNQVSTGAAGSVGSVGTVPSGTTIDLASTQRVCTNTAHAGDRFTATVSNPVSAGNGASIPAGAKAVVAVTEVKHSANATQPITMAFNVSSLSWGGNSFPIQSTIQHVDVQKVRNSSTSSDVKKVAGGAVIGAILGQVIGHNTKSTVIGAATGAAAGTAVAMGTAAYEGCVPVGGNIRIALTAPATIQAAAGQ